MKVSAVLVGVNVAATLSVAAQHPACAQDQHPTGGTAAFLKSTLSDAVAPAPISLSAAPAQGLSTSSSKTPLSNPRSVATRKALAQDTGVKLRPFQPNRRLPSKRELEAAKLAAQAPQMDYTPPAQAQPQTTTLDGGVAEYSNFYLSDTPDVSLSARAKYAVKQAQKKGNSQRLQNAAKVASSFVRQVAPRAVPGMSPVVPGSVGLPCAETAYGNFQNPVQMHREVPQHQMMQQMPRQQMPMQFAQQAPVAPPAPMQPPRLSPQEQLEMNKLVDNACIENGINPHATGAAADSLYARVGAPPFPLSLIPEDTMKGFLKGARTRKSPIEGSNLSMASGGGVGSGVGMGGGGGRLPAAGFHSYMQTSSQGYGNYSRIPTAMPISKHAVQPHGVSKAHHPVKAVKKTATVAHQASAHVSPASTRVEAPKEQVLVYPPYRSNANFGS